MKTWFSADLHLGHSNILKFSYRPFASIEEHDRCLIQNWNNHVAPRDDVYFLGDFAYRNKAAAASLRRKLNGNIFFIEGNHDTSAHQIRDTFGWYKEVHEVKVKKADGVDQRIFLSHYAHRVWNKSHHGTWHLYGHSHNTLPELQNSLSFDVGVDAVAARLSGIPSGYADLTGTLPQDYRPMSFEEVCEVMSKKTYKPVDHHGNRTDEQIVVGGVDE